MAILKLPKNADWCTYYTDHSDHKPEIYEVFELPIAKLVKHFHKGKYDHDKSWLAPRITLARDLTIEEINRLPAGYAIYGYRVLERLYNHSGAHPTDGFEWSSIILEVAEDEDFDVELTVDTEQFSSYHRDHLCIYRRHAPDYCRDVTRYIESRRFWPSREVKGRLLDLLGSWKAAPVAAADNRLSGETADTRKANGRAVMRDKLFPAALKPLPYRPPSMVGKSGRLLITDPDGVHPVAMPWEFFPEFSHGTYSVPMMITVGVRDDGSAYMPFRVPTFMQDEKWKGMNKAHENLPISAVMIYRSEKAYHLLYLMHTQVRTGSRSITHMPMRYCIPVVVDDFLKEPTLLRGLPASQMDAINTCPGLSSAMKKGLYALQGELLKLGRQGIDLSDFQASDLLKKPRYHVLTNLSTTGGATLGTPWGYGKSQVTLGNLLAEIQVMLSSRDYHWPMFSRKSRYVEPDGVEELQPVARVSRKLDL